jgi:glycosyltransferase involved in cell wall biosynthesis
LVIGEGSERSSLEAKIKDYKLEDYFQLIGLHQNPYPFIKAAKLYVQPSRYEGKSMAIEEAKILKKPIIVTNYLTAKDQIEPNVTGIIAEINAESIADAIEKLLSNEALQMKLMQNLSIQNFGTEDEMIKLYHLIHD